MSAPKHDTRDSLVLAMDAVRKMDAGPLRESVLRDLEALYTEIGTLRGASDYWRRKTIEARREAATAIANVDGLATALIQSNGYLARAVDIIEDAIGNDFVITMDSAAIVLLESAPKARRVIRQGESAISRHGGQP